MITKNNFSEVNEFESFVQSNPFLLLDFYADWCEPCKMLDEILLELESDHSIHIQICKIDVDQNTVLQKHFSIMSVPTLMIFKDGKMEWRMPGFELAKDLKKRILSYMT